MAILGSKEILVRLGRGEIFRSDTWDHEGVKEASYALRLAWDGIVVNGHPYPPGHHYAGAQIRIEPGRIAILSTRELIKMPSDLSGKVGVRLDFAALGLVGLMGIQVDPYYGSYSETKSERLYFRVANLSNEPIRLQQSDRVFNIELHDAVGAARPALRREDGWNRMQRLMKPQRDASWTYITRIESDMQEIEARFQPLVLFGVVLVAVTILGVAAAVLTNADPATAPSWVSGWGWMVLVLTLAAGGVATAFLVGAEAARQAARAFRGTGRLLDRFVGR